MREPRKVAVILVRSDPTKTPPTIAHCREYLLDGADSIAHYWLENTEDWFQFIAFDFLGPYDITLPPQPYRRGDIWNCAHDAATNAGVNLAPYDAYIVLNFPGLGDDSGAYGNVAVLGVSGGHTFFSHEVGHVLGFGHTFGILNAGSDWNNDNKVDLNPVYGDPYDIMSSATFGGSNPTMRLQAPFSGFPNSDKAGPMLSRALLHFTKPLAMEQKRKVRHIYEDGNDVAFQLFPAGGADDGQAELVVFHPSNEDSEGRGRIYVEYRQPQDFLPGTRWDKGLSVSAESRDRRGVIVHIVKNIPNTQTPAIWYAGRIFFPSPDADVEVSTPQGSAVVTVSDDSVQDDRPLFVMVRVTRRTQLRASIRTATQDQVKVVSTEERSIPGWELAGKFTWEHRETTRTVRYTPVVAGLGGESLEEAKPKVQVDWSVNNYMLPDQIGTATVQPAGLNHSVRLHYYVHPQTRVLTLTNEPSDGSFTIPVKATASDLPAQTTSVTADHVYTVEVPSEGWGQDYKDFMDFWYRVTHPIPIPEFGPPRPDDYRVAIEKLRLTFERLQVSNPVLAQRVQPLMVVHERTLQNFQRSIRSLLKVPKQLDKIID